MIMLIAKAKDKTFWDKVRTSEVYAPFRDELLEMWTEFGGREVPACRYSEFIMYDKTGSRKEYERSYFLRRRQLNTSALLSLIYPDEDKYLNYLLDVIWAVLDEYVWVLPAHMPSFKENVVEHIDLFAAETAFTLSEIEYLLGDRLPELIHSRIRAEVDRRVIQAYRRNTYWWDTSTNNWAAVCLCGVIGAVLYQKPELLDELLPRIRSTVSYFLSGFPDDGICLEGFGYWHYGFGLYTCLADLLYDYSSGSIDLFDYPKIRKIAGYADKMFLDKNTTVSFSDGSTTGRYHIGLLHYLKKKYPDDVTIPPREFSYSNDGCGRWCMHLRAILWFDEDLAYEKPRTSRTDYLEGAGWLIKVTNGYSFAAKGGTNDEPHNHNDLGAFIVVKDGKQLLTDPGAGTYDRAYFSSRRYEDFRASSRSHCVPIINGMEQAAGKSHTATTSYENGVFTVDFEKGYDIPQLISLKRTFSFTDSSVRLCDVFEYDGTPESFVERFVSTVEPKFTGDGIVLSSLTLHPEDDAVADVTVTETEYAGVKYYCIDFKLISESRSFELEISAG